MKISYLGIALILATTMAHESHSEDTEKPRLKDQVSDYQPSLQGIPGEWKIDEKGHMTVTLNRPEGIETKTFSSTPNESKAIEFLLQYGKNKQQPVSLRIDSENKLQGFGIHSSDQSKKEAKPDAMSPGRILLIAAAKDGSLDPNENAPTSDKWVGCIYGDNHALNKMRCVTLDENYLRQLSELEQEPITLAKSLLKDLGAPEMVTNGTLEQIKKDPTFMENLLVMAEGLDASSKSQAIKMREEFALFLKPLNPHVVRALTQALLKGTTELESDKAETIISQPKQNTPGSSAGMPAGTVAEPSSHPTELPPKNP